MRLPSGPAEAGTGAPPPRPGARGAAGRWQDKTGDAEGTVCSGRSRAGLAMDWNDPVGPCVNPDILASKER